VTKVAKKIGNFWGYVKTSVKNYWGLLFGVTLGETWATFMITFGHNAYGKIIWLPFLH